MKYILHIINSGPLNTARVTMVVMQGVVFDTVQAQHRLEAREEG